MKPELAKYINGLQDELSLRLWLSAASIRTTNGNANIVYRDLMLRYRCTIEDLKRCLNLKEAQEMGLIKILVETSTFITINFRSKELAVKLSKKEKASIEVASAPAASPPSKEKPKTNGHTQALVPAGQQLKAQEVDENGFLIGPLPPDYKPSYHLRRYVIGLYIKFYKDLQLNAAMAMGRTLENPQEPYISRLDAKSLNQIAMFWFTNPKLNTEHKIIYAFTRIFDSWEHFPDNIRQYTNPSQICRNINSINLILQNSKSNTIKTKRDELFEQKVRHSTGKDYSHLEQKK